MAINSFLNPVNKEDEENKAIDSSINVSGQLDQTQKLLTTQAQEPKVNLQSAVTQNTPFSKVTGQAEPQSLAGYARSLVEEEKKKGTFDQIQSSLSAKEIIKREQENAGIKTAPFLQKPTTTPEEKLDPKTVLSSIDPKNLNALNPNIVETKFGEIDFSKQDISSPGKSLVQFTDPTTKEALIYIPEEYILTGYSYRDPNTNESRTYYNTAFLDKTHWENFLNKSQYVNLGATSLNFNSANLPDITKAAINSSYKNPYSGFLIKASDKDALIPQDKAFWHNIEGNTVDLGGNGQAVHNKIMGIVEKDGELVYLIDTTYNYGDKSSAYAWINSNAERRTTYQWYTAPERKGGVLGEIQDLGREFAKIPFAAEAIGIATGSPEIYALVKGLQTVGVGGDTGDVLKSMVTSYAAASAPQLLKAPIGSMTSALTPSLGATAANVVSTAAMQSIFNGALAAVNNQDIEKAMITGAVSGGVAAGGAQLANGIVGGEANLKSIASTLNLRPEQLQAIIASSVATSAISAVQGQDFFKAFTNSLMTQGVSASVANTVGQTMMNQRDENGNVIFSPDKVKLIADTTYKVLMTGTQAALAGRDVKQALIDQLPILAAERSVTSGAKTVRQLFG